MDFRSGGDDAGSRCGATRADGAPGGGARLPIAVPSSIETRKERAECQLLRRPRRATSERNGRGHVLSPRAAIAYPVLPGPPVEVADSGLVLRARLSTWPREIGGDIIGGA